MAMRPFGAFNGVLPEPTGVLVGYLRDEKAFPYLRYTELVAAPEVQFFWFAINSDEPVRVPRDAEFDWAYGDYRPTGKGFNAQVDVIQDRVRRYDLPYTIGDEVIRVWQKAGFNVKMMYDQIRGQQFQVLRAWQAVTALSGASWGANNTGTPQDLLGAAAPVYWNNSLGSATLPSGNLDERFLVIKKTLNRIKKRINLATNGAVAREQLLLVIPPAVAEAISETHEIQEALKQSRFAKELTESTNANDWNLPESYAGFTFVVEDTPRVKINQQADGSVADVTVASEKDYVLDSDTCYVVSRPRKLDGVYGQKTFSTLQMYHYRGEGRVEAFSEPKHELIEGHIVGEHKFVTPSLISGFKLTDVLA